MYLHALLWMMCIVLFISNTDSRSVTANNLIPCGDGWFHYDRKCYKFLGEDKPLSWKQASVSCSLVRGTLATIHSAELQEFFVSFFILRAKRNAWIGLNDLKKESEFTWDDLSPLIYINWDSKQPSRTLGKEHCVEMVFRNYLGKLAIGSWNDRTCDTELPYYCQADESADVLSQDPRFCSIEEGGGWKYLNSCYHIVTKAKSWEDAEYHCKEIFKGHLVTILDKETEMFLSYVFPNYTENFWIGIKMRNQSVQVWSSGWRVFYKKWDHDPTHVLENTCGMMSMENLWTIGPCFRELPFICEKSKNEAPVPNGWQCPDLSEEWVDLNGDHCYIFETSKSLNWYEANYECGRKGGNLASIRSKEESYILHRKMGDSQEKIFIGLHRSLSDKNVFEWADGSTFDFQDWEKGAPNDRREECGEIRTETMKWNDIPCNIKKGYICSAKKMPPINLDIIDINTSERNEFVHTRTSNKTEQQDEVFASVHQDGNISCGTSSESVTVVTVCILLLVVVMLGIVVYNYRDFLKRKFNSSLRNSNDPQSFSYISSERILKP